MTKTSNKYEITYRKFKELLEKKPIPNNLLIFLSEKILLEEIIKLISEKFLGSSENSKDSVKHYFSDGNSIESVISECSNINFFSEKKIIIYKIVKKPGVRGIPAKDKSALLNYIGNYNTDIILLMVVTEKEKKDIWKDKVEFSINNFKEFFDAGIPSFIIEENNEKDMISWIKERFAGYKIDEQTILHLLQFLNISYDEIITEVEKLKTYCVSSKEITIQDVNLSVGISKDFSGNDFIAAIFTKDKNKAIKIYQNLTLKEDIETRLFYLLTSAYIALSKLKDKSLLNEQNYSLKWKLKIYNNPDKMIPLYKNYSREINELKIMLAFDYIYKAEKALKSTNTDTKTVFTTLINKLAGL